MTEDDTPTPAGDDTPAVVGGDTPTVVGDDPPPIAGVDVGIEEGRSAGPPTFIQVDVDVEERSDEVDELTSEDVGPYRVTLPEYGPIQAAIGFVMFYLLVDLATEPLTAGLQPLFPGFVPDPFTTALAALLWLVLGLNVYTETDRQFRSNPRSFDDEASLVGFLDDRRPSVWRLVFDLTLAAVGGALVAVAWPAFPAAFSWFVGAWFDLAVLSTVTVATALTIVSFLVGVGLLAYGLDRLLVGLLRVGVYAAHRSAGGPPDRAKS